MTVDVTSPTTNWTTITYGNNGNGPAAGVIVADTLPAGLNFVSAVPTPSGSGPSWNNLGATPGTLAVGESGTITLVAQLDNNYALVGQTLLNVATISTSSGEVNLGDNRAQAPVDCITADFVSLTGYARVSTSGQDFAFPRAVWILGRRDDASA